MGYLERSVIDLEVCQAYSAFEIGHIETKEERDEYLKKKDQGFDCQD